MHKHVHNGEVCSDPTCWCKRFPIKEKPQYKIVRDMLPRIEEPFNLPEDYGFYEEDVVNNPKHYQMEVEGSPLESLQVIEAALSDEEFRGYLKGNCIKYLLRANKKGGDEDLAKMAYYAKRFERG